MTNLSLAAQAVLIAEAKSRCLREERDCHLDDSDWNGCYICIHRRGLAAALRAAGEQIEDLYCKSNVNSDEGVVFALRQLVLIAKELEAQ